MDIQSTSVDYTFDAVRKILAGQIFQWTANKSLLETEISGLLFVKYESSSEPMILMYDPCICLVVQGSKRAVLGDEEYVYNANNYLITSVGLPVTANVVAADKEKPLLGLILKIDLQVIAQMMVDSDLPAVRKHTPSRGMAVSKISFPLLHALQRLVELLDHPEDIPILAPLIHKEILYRLLVGEQGVRLRQIASTGSHAHRIARAIDWLRENYAQHLKIESLARDVGMSLSTFHQHFRTITAMSPLQYQKKMRLLEARRLMLTEQHDAASAALQVGYESPSQFSREYRRQFGAPPLRDIKKLQERAQSGGPHARA